MDTVGAALYVKDAKPGVKSIAGINQNYAWGQDSWGDFEPAMKVLVPSVEVKTSQMPKLFAGQYNAEISALLSAKPDVIHSSFWDGDLEALILQARAARAHEEEPDHPHHGRDRDAQARRADSRRHGARRARAVRTVMRRTTQYNKWFHGGLRAKYKDEPNYASYQMAQAILGVKARVGEGAGGATAASARATSRSAPRSRARRSRAPAARCGWRSARGTRRSWRRPTARPSWRTASSRGQRQALSGRKSESARGREVGRLDQERL